MGGPILSEADGRLFLSCRRLPLRCVYAQWHRELHPKVFRILAETVPTLVCGNTSGERRSIAQQVAEKPLEHIEALSASTAQTLSEILGGYLGRPSSKRRVESFFPYVVPTSSTRILQTDVVNSLRLILTVARAGTVTNNTLPDISCYTNPWRMPVYKSGLARLRRTRRHRAGATEKVKEPLWGKLYRTRTNTDRTRIIDAN